MINNINIEIFEKVLLCYKNANEILNNAQDVFDTNIYSIDLLTDEHNNLVNEFERFKSRIEFLTIEKIDLNNKILNPTILSTEKNSLKDELNDLRIKIDSLENNKELLKTNRFKNQHEVIHMSDILRLDSYLDDQLKDLNEKFKVLKEHYDELNPNKTEMDLEDNLNELCYKSYELSILEKKINPTLVELLKISKELDDLFELNSIQILKSFYNDGMHIEDINKIFEDYTMNEIKEIIDLDLDIPDEFILNMDFNYE